MNQDDQIMQKLCSDPNTLDIAKLFSSVKGDLSDSRVQIKSLQMQNEKRDAKLNQHGKSLVDLGKRIDAAFAELRKQEIIFG